MAPDQGGGGEKTEKATPKKREDARKKGQVLKSAEVNTAVLTVSMFLTLFGAGGFIVSRLVVMLNKYLGGFGGDDFAGELTRASLHLRFVQVLLELLFILSPLLLAALVMGFVTNVAQFGFLFVTDTLKPKFSKINPIEGFKRIFSMKTVVELLKAVAKVLLVGLIVYQEYIGRFGEFPNMMALGVPQAAGVIADMCFGIAVKACLMLVVIGVVDYLYQWWEFEKNLKMSKEEIKQEYKQTEGDPLIRSKRREKQRQMSMMRLMQAVPQADVVITNPTHYAVAIRYDQRESEVPMVIAKGKDRIALKIREVAREHRIQIVENKPVAQALYLGCNIDQEIPRDMFAAVAEILAFVYKQNGNRPVRTAPPRRNTTTGQKRQTQRRTRPS